MVVLRARRAARRADRPQRRRCAAVLRHAHQAAAPFTDATLARALLRYPLMPLQVTEPDPPPGGEALAEARAVLPDAVRARRGIGEAVTEVLRELPAGRRIGARFAERRAPRARPDRARRAGAATSRRARVPGRHGRPDRRHRHLERRLPPDRTVARLGFGESYAAGDWHTDDLPGLIALVVRNLEAWRAGSRIARLDRHRPHVSPRQGLRKAQANIQWLYYGLGNDLYRLFLDESMTYSCALWEEGDTLEQAQQRKLRAICQKLRLRPGDHVLEIGCGRAASR